MIARRGSAKKKHEARVAWLKARPLLFVGVPGINDDVTDDNRPLLEELHREMSKHGLLGATGPEAQREVVRRPVSELRGQSIGAGSW